MKKQDGLGMLGIIILICIIVALITGIVIFVQNRYQDEKTKNIQTNLLKIQAKVSTINQEVMMKKEGANLKGVKLSEKKQEDTFSWIFSNQILKDEEAEKYYILSKEDLEQMELLDIDMEDTYIVNYETKEVITTKGYFVKEENKSYYKLSEITEKMK